MASPTDIAGLIARLQSHGGRRLIAAVAGAPGSGKSTVASQLEVALNAERPGVAAVLPMDGFHYDDMLLRQLGRLERKGAPDTFDVGGLHHLIARLRSNDEAEVAVPVFDRDLEISRGSARLIPRSFAVIIVEGNYLLLRQSPWAALKPLFDISVMVETPPDVLRRRLTARWEGYRLPADEVRRRVEENDLPNGRRVMADSTEPDFVLAN
jgi:pantothenate kinase